LGKGYGRMSIAPNWTRPPGLRDDGWPWIEQMKKHEKSRKYNIGDTINFSNEYGEVCEGEIVGAGSDKYTGSDSGSVDVILEDGIFSYWSKKTDKYVPVKEKSIDSLFLEVKDSKKCINFISPKEIIL
jgi:hypothetical protein